MEPAYSLKRERSVEYEMCIICQENKNDKLLYSEKGLLSLKDAAQSRQTFIDPKNRLSIDRIMTAVDRNIGTSLHWHKLCYALFTSKSHIARLAKSKQDLASSSKDILEQSTNTTPRTSRRSMGPAISWECCMFCQNADSGEKLSSVSTFNKSNEILESSKYDPVLRVRLADVNDLIASEGKYHLSCFVNFDRRTKKTRGQTYKVDLPMQWLIVELKESAQKAHVLELSEVWKRYCALCDIAESEIPQSFQSRRATFREKLEPHVENDYDFISIQNKQTLLVPLKFERSAIYKLVTDDQDETSPISVYKSIDDDFLEMVHVALKLRSDIFSHPLYKGFVISEDEMISSVPESLFMFIRLLFGGQKLFESDPDDEQFEMQERESKTQSKVLSIAQDLVYNVTGGKHWTPKHLGLASTLHQATRSKDLVQLFHNAGHTLSYDNVLQVDTALAEKTLNTLDPQSGAVIPPNFTSGRFVHFTCDNIDINDSSFDGKDSFHATQVAAWQRGPESDMGLKSLKPSTNTSLQVPEIMEEIFPSEISEGKTEPKLTAHTRMEWYGDSQDVDEANQAIETDMAFFISRQDEHEVESRNGWTYFNQIHTSENQEITSIGYMPIIQAPAHEMDTLNTVVQRCKHVAMSLGQRYVVLTVDEALFGKLMELKWAREDYSDCLVVRLGGLHTALNYLKVIGQHMQSSGLLEVWTDSNILGPKAAEQVLAGKHYSRGMRAHKLTLQALWRILMPQLLEYIETNDEIMREDIDSKKNDPDSLMTCLASPKFKKTLDDFVKSRKNPNFKFWYEYIDMIENLLLFTRAQREGNWKLHLFSFRAMLPYFMRYNHTNYARWGTIYLNEMHQLPYEVETEFSLGHFVVKRSKQNFNQVSPDQSQEWLNGTGKKGGGIVGITKTQSALSRWALSYNLRSNLASETKEMYGCGSDDIYSHNESTKGRLRKDNLDEDRLYNTFSSLNIISKDDPENLQNILTKDLATQKIEDDLLSARQKGQEQLNRFVEDRILPKEQREVKFHDPLPKNKTLTFTSLFEIFKGGPGTSKTNPIKADRKILQRLITAYEAHRDVNLDSILCHELLTVPAALAQLNGSLRSSSKAILAEELCEGVSRPATLDQNDLGGEATLIIDGQAMVIALGRPNAASTFGDFADHFVNCVLQAGSQYKRIDVLFDRYYTVSIKAGTRKKRTHGSMPIRRPIENREVPLPTKMDNFLAHPDNKADLARFLSQQLIIGAPRNKVIVVGGGFSTEERVEASIPDIEIESLEAKHEEADTRVIVHCVESNSSVIVVAARDTDILVLLIAHFHKMKCIKLWLKAGTAKKRKYIPVHKIIEKLELEPDILENLVAFHALTGCDTTSYLGGHSKKTCWRVFLAHHILLNDLGKGDLTSTAAKDAELFICKIYGVPNADSTNKARSQLFVKSRAPESLPPTSDALSFHIKRAHYQAAVWRQANKLRPELPNPEEMGWKLEEGSLVPILMTLTPVPESCIELISCKCTTRCTSARCKCRKTRLACTAACKCRDANDTCFNN